MTYFKRFRMRADLNRLSCRPPRKFPGYQFVAWTDRLLPEHAEAKFASFRNELDAHVFPCLGNWQGCQKLMTEIAKRNNFVPQATWLLVRRDPASSERVNCGTVQGVSDGADVGSIQNLGLVQSERGFGLGSELLRRSLAGFAEVGVRYVDLEVTSKNDRAIALYQRIGFEMTQVVYKFADLAY